MKKIDYSFIIVTIVIIFLYAISFFFTGEGLPCIILEKTGLYCPGCGISRMFISIIRLDFYQAFRYNPLIFILLITCILFGIVDTIYYIRNKKHINIPNYIYIILLLIIIAYGIMRNIPMFSYLEPTVVN